MVCKQGCCPCFTIVLYACVCGVCTLGIALPSVAGWLTSFAGLSLISFALLLCLTLTGHAFLRLYEPFFLFFALTAFAKWCLSLACARFCLLASLAFIADLAGSVLLLFLASLGSCSLRSQGFPSLA